MIIGTRGSALAKTQTNWVRKFIEEKLDAPVDVVVISTQGDRVTDRPLRELEGSGYFTKELEQALLERRVDIAVHSYKDMPSQSPQGLSLAAVSTREDVADLLIMRREAVTMPAEDFFLKPGAVVGTSAVRREAQLRALRPDLKTKDLRGNVPTRLTKLHNGEYDAILLASAGVRRLGIDMSEFRVERLEPSRFVPAPGQGALAIQMRTDDDKISLVKEAIHNETTFAATRMERRVQALFGGGCGLPLGVNASFEKGEWTLEGFWFSENTGAVRATVRGTDTDKLADELYHELNLSCQAEC
ncbi:MAG: hydroxymethylbilane synthase [Calditrichaeota bacterium]|nr:hydroxymethylbilane synthase [Calditrichota bacterium]MCB9369840.1 hydroxymethylbilane synthase [Calditrichota bacterium]